MTSKTIKISEENYIWLLQLAGDLQKKHHKQITFDNTLSVLKNGKMEREKLSDLAGSWNISDKEAEALKKEVKKNLEMENAVCLDSDFLIDFLRKKEYALNWIRNNEDKCILATTIINAFELFTGAYGYDENAVNAVKNIISKLKILEFSIKSAEESGKQYVELARHGNIIEHRDLFIGIIALTEGFSIKTNNVKHFSRIKGLKIV